MDIKAMKGQISNLNDTEKEVITEMVLHQATDEELAEHLKLSPGIVRKIKIIAMRKLIGIGEYVK